jgi:alanine dehydrogenase
MLVLDADAVHARMSMPRLIAALEEAFRTQCIAPTRQIARISSEDEAEERLLLSMPAFDAEGGMVKVATVFPENRRHGLPTIQAAVIVFSARGSPVAILDGATITRFRTAASSALASKYLSRENSHHLVVVGTGALAPYMVLGHCAVRPINRVSICGRRPDAARATASAAKALLRTNIEVTALPSIAEALAMADIVTCATSSSTPVLAGKWLRAGTFVDLVGSFSRSKREVDDETVQRARLFVDTLDGALSEAGDLLDPLSRGVIDRGRIEGELADLVRGTTPGRTHDDQVILFKSVGASLEDLAAARLVLNALH